jgi:hypothetical protein
MKPTYSIAEIRLFIGSFDLPELDLLTGLVKEEAALYTAIELKDIQALIAVAQKERANNELQLEYLLSFN